MRPNLPTPEGILLGEQTARMTDGAEAQLRRSLTSLPERCETCAFRLGTLPNGCPTTQMDALKCVMEHVPFNCHERPGVCSGWLIATKAGGPERHEAWWPFSDEME